jgi:hypothetical protein
LVSNTQLHSEHAVGSSFHLTVTPHSTTYCLSVPPSGPAMEGLLRNPFKRHTRDPSVGKHLQRSPAGCSQAVLRPPVGLGGGYNIAGSSLADFAPMGRAAPVVLQTSSVLQAVQGSSPAAAEAPPPSSSTKKERAPLPEEVLPASYNAKCKGRGLVSGGSRLEMWGAGQGDQHCLSACRRKVGGLGENPGPGSLLSQAVLEGTFIVLYRPGTYCTRVIAPGVLH